jgi:hypothetical protein
MKRTAESIQQEILKKEAEIANLNTQLDFIKEVGEDNYNDDDFKAYQILKEIGITDIHKAKAIVRILQQKIS